MKRSAVQNRLRHYWKIEAANVIAVPTVGAIAVLRFGGRIDLLMVIAALAMSSLLVVGTMTLRAHFQMSEGNCQAMAEFVPIAAKLQRPMAVLSALAVLSAAFAIWRDAGFAPSSIATFVFALLATLEYINYFVVQLQHFDHGADFRRLISGRGFRRSHLARAITRFRSGKTGTADSTAP
jgi:hypothetical protein